MATFDAWSRLPPRVYLSGSKKIATIIGGYFAYNSFIFLVPGGGLEPPRPCGLRILSPLRLPISPSGRLRITVAGTVLIWQCSRSPQ